MKKFFIMILASASLLMAGGGDYSFNAEPYVPIQEVSPEPEKNIYVGIGYSCMQFTTDDPDFTVTAMKAVSVTLGYSLFDNLDIETRYTTNIGDLEYKDWSTDTDVNFNFSNIGLYLKPNVDFYNLNMYGLLGYGKTRLAGKSEYGLQYGVGVGLKLSDSLDTYVDYRRLQEDDEFSGISLSNAVNSFTTGMNYKF